MMLSQSKTDLVDYFFMLAGVMEAEMSSFALMYDNC